MTRVEQSEDDCFLATIAMLAGKPLDEVRQDVAKRLHTANSRYFWGDYLTSMMTTGARSIKDSIATVRRITDAVCRDYGLPALNPAVTRGTIRENLTVPATGKGQLVILLGHEDEIGRIHPFATHSVAYENGLIYDSNLPLGSPGESWDAFRIRLFLNEDTYAKLVEVTPCP